MKFYNLLTRHTATRQKVLSVSMEDISDGVAREEYELVFYAKVSDKAIFDTAESSEKHEQWGFKSQLTNGVSLQQRIRRTEKNDEISYNLTTKTFKHTSDDDRNIKTESTVSVSPDVFEQYKSFCDGGMIKQRFNYPKVVNDQAIIIEVDAYPKDDGYQEWVKIDIEIPEGFSGESEFDWLSILPKEFTEVIDGRSKDPEVSKKISELYKNYFLTRNEGM